MNSDEKAHWRGEADRARFEEDIFLYIHFEVAFLGDKDLRVFPMATSDNGNAIIPFQGLVLSSTMGNAFTMQDVLQTANTGLPDPWNGIIDRRGAFQDVIEELRAEPWRGLMGQEGLIAANESTAIRPDLLVRRLIAHGPAQASGDHRIPILVQDPGIVADPDADRDALREIAKRPWLLQDDFRRVNRLVRILMEAAYDTDHKKRKAARQLLQDHLKYDRSHRKKLIIPAGTGRLAADLLLYLAPIEEPKTTPHLYADLQLREKVNISLHQLELI